MKSIILSLMLMFSIESYASTKGVQVIYGDDNRTDIHEVKSKMYKDLAKSTAGMIPNGAVQNYGTDEVRISGMTLAQRNICSSERFSTQITAANCSGFLVGPNLLATAGHCVRTQSDCDRYKWVFDYNIKSADQKEHIIKKNDVYSCKRIIRRSLDSRTKNDFALIELDRHSERRALRVRAKGKVEVGAPLVVIGHPTGLPTKVADDATVRSLKGTYFVANLDTYGGNSGSAVFNAKTGLVEGILVRGERDYVRGPNGCMISNRCSQYGCRGEEVTYAKELGFFVEEVQKDK